MAYAIMHFFPGGTKEQYEASIAAVHPSRSSLPEGQIFHVARPSNRRMANCGGSQFYKESWERFRDGTLLPQMQKGIAGGLPILPGEHIRGSQPAEISPRTANDTDDPSNALRRPSPNEWQAQSLVSIDVTRGARRSSAAAQHRGQPQAAPPRRGPTSPAAPAPRRPFRLTGRHAMLLQTLGRGEPRSRPSG